MLDHIADAIKKPDIVKLEKNLFVARFESLKIYSALAAVECLLQSGTVCKGQTLLDSSSGIYAYALALACHKYGMKCHIVASKTVDKTLMLQLQILGATIEQVPSAASLKLDQRQRVERIQKILSESPEIYWMQQYHDDLHYQGYSDFAALIQMEFPTDNLAIVGGVGSGCSTGGVVKFLRERNENVELIGVQPFGSMTFGSEHIEDPGIIIAGIGSSIPFKNVKHELYNKIHWISFDYGRSGAIDLLRHYGLFAGLSSGCSYLAAQWEAKQFPEKNIVFIAPDTGHRYTDSVFANHENAKDIHNLQPNIASTLDELALPWSAMSWDRKSFKKLIGE